MIANTVRKQGLLTALVAISGLFASACGSIGGFTDQCMISIKEALINPETLEVYDKRNLSKEEFIDALLEVKMSDISADSSTFRESSRRMIESQVGPIIDSGGINLYSARIKAETAMGNKSTRLAACYMSDGQCDCEISS